MNPIKIAGANRALQPPPNWDEEKDGVCETLHVYAHVPPDGTIRISSAWLPNAEELAALNAGHPVVLTVFGSGIPPMSIGVSAEPYGDGAPMLTVDQAFEEAMRGYLYGERQTANAKAWFAQGWWRRTGDKP